MASAALANSSPAVRYWAAKTIRLKRQEISGLPAVRNTMLRALGQAAIRETDDPALREIYVTLDFTQVLERVPFAEELLRVFVDILEARGQRYVDGTVTVSEADTVALVAMGRLAVPMNSDAQADRRRRYLTALAQMLCRIVDGYVGQLEIEEASKRDLALIRRCFLAVREIEKELRRVVGEAGVKTETMPNLLLKMQGANTEEIVRERNRWCGWPPNERGVLNEKPFDVPLGAGFAEAGTPPAGTPSSEPK